MEFEAVTSEYDFDIDLLVVYVGLSELVSAEREVPKVHALDLELLNGVSDVECLSPTHFCIKWTGVVLRYLVCLVRTHHHPLIARYLIRLVAAISEGFISEAPTEHTALVHTVCLALKGRRHQLTRINITGYKFH